MTARIIDGRAIARSIEDRLTARVKGRTGRAPSLVAVLVGDDPGSVLYIKRKSEAAARIGIQARTERLPTAATQEDVAGLLDRLAREETVDGILLQLPVPLGLDADALMARIPPEKDVDCFHPANVGAVALGRGALRPCTPQGVMEILDHERVPLQGAHVVIVNHSRVVGRPLALLLLARNATVTVCHEFTKDLGAETRRADVLITGTGVAGLITKDHVKPGAVVIDVGITRAKDGGVAGDVRFDEVQTVAGAITPVPGGVGPLTVAMLMQNVVAAHEARAVRGGHR